MMMPSVIQAALKLALRRFASAPVVFELHVQTAKREYAPEVVLYLSAGDMQRMTQPGSVITVRENGVQVAEIVL